MIDANTFLLMLLYAFGSVLLVALIVLVVKLIGTVNRMNSLLDQFETKMRKLDGLFNVVDTVTDSLSMVSDKLVDGVSHFIKKIFYKNKEIRKDDDVHE